MNYYYVEYNGAFIASYKTLKGALNYIDRKGLQDDCDNTLRVFDRYGEQYNPINGNKLA